MPKRLLDEPPPCLRVYLRGGPLNGEIRDTTLKLGDKHPSVLFFRHIPTCGSPDPQDTTCQIHEYHPTETLHMESGMSFPIYRHTGIRIYWNG